MSTERQSTFNNSDFIFELTILDETGQLIQPFSKNEILHLDIERDLTKYYDGGYVLVKDISNFFSVLVNKTGKWFLSVNIVQTESVEEIEKSSYSKIFLITSAVIESVDTDCARVKIGFTDAIEQIFNRHAAYSSQQSADACEVLTGLLNSIGFKNGAQGNRALPEFGNSGHQLNYITDANCKALVHIENVLSQIYSEERGFLYLYYDNGLKNFWTKDILNSKLDAESPESSCYCLFLQSDDSQIRNVNGIVEILSYDNLINYSDGTRIIYPTFIQEFNNEDTSVNISEEWTTNNFEDLLKSNDDDFNILVPGDIESSNNALLNNGDFFELAPDYQVGQFYRASNSDSFYKDLRRYFQDNNLFSFKVQGHIAREPGQLFVIAYEKGANSGKFSGNWFCYKIVNEFENGKFYQYIFLTRSSDKVNHDDALEHLNNTIEDYGGAQA